MTSMKIAVFWEEHHVVWWIFLKVSEELTASIRLNLWIYHSFLFVNVLRKFSEAMEFMFVATKYVIWLNVTGNCYGVVSYTAFLALRPFLSDLLFVPIWVLITLDSSTRALWQILAEASSSELGRNLARNILILPAKYLCHTLQWSLTCRKILRHRADGFISPPKEVVLRIFIDLKNSPFSSCFEPANPGPVASTITTRPTNKRACL
jgi:hypothetical protein